MGWAKLLFKTEEARASFRERPERHYSYLPVHMLDGEEVLQDVNSVKLFHAKKVSLFQRLFCWSSWLVRIPRIILIALIFPMIDKMLLPFVDTMHGDFIGELTCGFIPSMSLLFAILVGFSIETLISMQLRIRNSIMNETGNLSFLTMQLVEVLQDHPDQSLLRRCLGAVLKQTTILAGKTRREEIMYINKNDPYHEIQHVLNKVDDDLKQDRAVGFLQACILARGERIDAEGEAMGPAQFRLLLNYAIILMLSMTSLFVGNTDLGAACELMDTEVVFALTVEAFSLVLNFIRELNSPFCGKLSIRLGLSTLQIFNIRQQALEGLRKLGRHDRKNGAYLGGASNRLAPIKYNAGQLSAEHEAAVTRSTRSRNFRARVKAPRRAKIAKFRR